MKDKIKCILLFVSVFVGAGYALSCYSCSGNALLECTHDSPGLKETPCSVEHSPVLQFCIIKAVYDKVEKKEVVLAGCDSLRKPVGRVGKELVPAPLTVLDKNVEQCQSNERYDVTSCEVCRTNFCNFANSASVTRINAHSLWWLFLFYVSTKFIFR